jgi:hypothetical protein
MKRKLHLLIQFDVYGMHKRRRPRRALRLNANQSQYSKIVGANRWAVKTESALLLQLVANGRDGPPGGFRPSRR